MEMWNSRTIVGVGGDQAGRGGTRERRGLGDLAAGGVVGAGGLGGD